MTRWVILADKQGKGGFMSPAEMIILLLTKEIKLKSELNIALNVQRTQLSYNSSPLCMNPCIHVL